MSAATRSGCRRLRHVRRMALRDIVACSATVPDVSICGFAVSDIVTCCSAKALTYRDALNGSHLYWYCLLSGIYLLRCGVIVSVILVRISLQQSLMSLYAALYAAQCAVVSVMALYDSLQSLSYRMLCYTATVPVTSFYVPLQSL